MDPIFIEEENLDEIAEYDEETLEQIEEERCLDIIDEFKNEIQKEVYVGPVAKGKASRAFYLSEFKDVSDPTVQNIYDIDGNHYLMNDTKN